MCISHDQASTAPAADVPALSRRGVLRAATAATVGAAGVLAAAGPAEASSGRHGGSRRVPLDHISVQLYTLRDQLAIDLDGTLAALRPIGYTPVEHAGFV